MSRLARLDTGDGSAPVYAAIDLGADQSEIWVKMRLKDSSASWSMIGIYANGDFPTTQLSSTAPAGDTGWHTVEWHYAASGDTDLYIDGSLALNAGPNDPTQLRTVAIGVFSASAAGVIIYVDSVRIGTTRGGSDLFSDDFEGGTFAAWTTTTGDASIVAGSSMGTGRVRIGFDANMLDANPTWTTLDDVRDNLVVRVEARDGRQTESDETEAGTCTVWLNDTTGLFDRNNLSSPYWTKLDGKPISISCWNPVDTEWVEQWRGTIDAWRTVLDPSTRDGVSVLANVQIEAVGVFDYLARAEMRVGISGTTPPAGSEGIIFYDDGDVQTRITQLLDDAGIDPDMYVAFSGNVNVLECQYDPGDNFLSALRQAADAEFPGIANCYEDKLGRFVFHGRFARLDPVSVWTSIAGTDAARDAVWKFRSWKAGDGAAIGLDAERAQIREFAYAAPRDLLVNSATCYPADIAQSAIPDQIAEDLASITDFGIHGRVDSDLVVKEHKTNADTGAQQCLKYATFWTTYYAQPLERIERIVFKSVRPGDARAAATWGVLTGASISDVMNVSVGYPGGTGIQDVDHYIEGRTLTIEPATDNFDMVTLELNLSPYIEDTEGIFG